MWNGIFPPALLGNESAAFGAFSAVNMVMSKYNGTFPSTFLETGLQWDAPNAWPPHQYIILEALANIPSNVSSQTIQAAANNGSVDSFSLVPAGQLGVDEGGLPGQRIISGGNATAGGDLSKQNGTVINGGNATAGETWSGALQRELANRYMASALCSW
jgi:alpha,alpha-trehalase